MTNEQRSRIESLCRQIDVVQDENVLMRLMSELHELIRQWLSELHHPQETPRFQMTDGFSTQSKINGNRRHHTEYDRGTSAGNYEAVVDAAAALMRSDYASLQKLYPERGAGGELRLLAFRGFNPLAAAFWEWVRADSKSTCGMALRSRRRVVAPNIDTCDFMVDSEDQQVYLQTGIHACQTTPLITRSGRVVGMISTHWRMPHQPSKQDFRLLDILANEAADIIQRGGTREEREH